MTADAYRELADGLTRAAQAALVIAGELEAPRAGAVPAPAASDASESRAAHDSAMAALTPASPSAAAPAPKRPRRTAPAGRIGDRPQREAERIVAALADLSPRLVDGWAQTKHVAEEAGAHATGAAKVLKALATSGDLVHLENGDTVRVEHNGRLARASRYRARPADTPAPAPSAPAAPPPAPETAQAPPEPAQAVSEPETRPAPAPREKPPTRRAMKPAPPATPGAGAEIRTTRERFTAHPRREVDVAKVARPHAVRRPGAGVGTAIGEQILEALGRKRQTTTELAEQLGIERSRAAFELRRLLGAGDVKRAGTKGDDPIWAVA